MEVIEIQVKNDPIMLDYTHSLEYFPEDMTHSVPTNPLKTLSGLVVPASRMTKKTIYSPVLASLKPSQISSIRQTMILWAAFLVEVVLKKLDAVQLQKNLF